MRKLMWFSVGFCAACVLCAYWLLGGVALIFAFAGGIACIGLSFVPHHIFKPIALALLGLSVGLLYCWGYDGIILGNAKDFDGKSHYITMEASDYSFDTGYGYGVDGKTRLNGRFYRVRLFFQSLQDVEPGDMLSGKVELRYTPEGGLKNSTYHKGDGIFLLAYASDTMDIQKSEKLPAKYFPAYLREKISQMILEIFPEETAGFASALLLGDDSQITFADNIAFQKSGIRHIIAVSGLHISILFSVLYFFTGRRKWLTFLVGMPTLLLFAAVAGFTPSVVRACLMQMLVILAICINKEYDPATSLSFAVLLMLVLNPLTVTSVSFQLSAGSMVGIFSFSQPIRRYLRDEKRFGNMKGTGLKARLKRWISGSVSVTVSAMVVTMPLCALYFGMVSVISILTNLLTLWVISFVFCGIMTACIVSVLWIPLGSAVAYIVSVPIRFVLCMARLCSNIPFGVAYTSSPYTVLWIVCTIVLIALFLLSKKRSAVLLTVIVAGLYALSLLATWIEPKLDNVRLTVLDVGQGQCILLQSKDEAYLIDCGSGDPQRTAEAALCAVGGQGIVRLDGLILTHYDEDHANGAEYLLQVVPVDNLYLPDTEPANSIRDRLESLHNAIDWVVKQKILSCGTGEIRLYPAKSSAKGNESSMCILFQGKNCDILITGDRDIAGEQYLLSQGDIPKLEVLVVGHHGASTSTGLALLNAAKPKIAVISVGDGNIHGHPGEETLKRLERAGCIIKRTDLEGTIMIRG